MTTTKEMTIREFRDFLENEVDWVQIHKLSTFGNYGDSINVFTDGQIRVLSGNTYYQDYSNVALTINAEGRGNIDIWAYLDGWGEWDQNSDIFMTDDGRSLTTDEAIEEAIETGDWTEWISNEIKNAVEFEQQEREICNQ